MTKTPMSKGENIEVILDMFDDPLFKTHALTAIDYGISLRKLLRLVGTTYQTVYGANSQNRGLPKHLKASAQRYIFCEAVRFAVANNMFSKRYGRSNNYNVLTGIITLVEYNRRLLDRNDPAE